MIKALISDFSKVLCFRKDDPGLDKLNEHHENLRQAGEYDFWSHFTVNTKLLEYYNRLSDRIEIYIFTTAYIQEYPPVMERLKPHFKNIFSAARLGFSKTDANSYKKLSEMIEKSPEEIIFIDDTEPNIQAAKSAGLQTIHFHDADAVIQSIENLITNK